MLGSGPAGRQGHGNEAKDFYEEKDVEILSSAFFHPFFSAWIGVFFFPFYGGESPQTFLVGRYGEIFILLSRSPFVFRVPSRH
jgi:hypothetical protein